MNLRKAFLVAVVPVLALTASGSAEARGGWGFGFGLGVGLLATAPLWAASPYYYPPYYGAAYYPYPYYGYGPYYASPARYVDRGQVETPIYAPAPVRYQPFSYFYCPSSNGYYPYARECPGGWQRVPGSPIGM
jgi:hypothetical protein